MTPTEFVSKWSDIRLRERQASHEHFLDLCHLLGQPTPGEDDATGERYCFDYGVEKVGGGAGFADVWRKGCFGWEYKGRLADLNAALRQLQAYTLDLQNPPYLVVSDFERIVVHTNWTNTISRRIEIGLDDLLEPAKRDVLRQVFEGSEALKPGFTPQELTAKVAARFGELGRRLQDRKHDPRAVAHFLNRLVFCMFAEDAKLLPDGLFTRVVRATETRPDHATSQLGELFGKMRTGGFFGADVIRWFNGGLFDDATVLPLERGDLKLIGDTAGEHDWSEIDPAIFGSLFEQALKATRERPALGAHYTDREKILQIVDPVIVRPLTAEWEAAFAEIRASMEAVRQSEADRKAVLEEAAEAMMRDPAAAKAGEAARRKRLTAIAKARDAAYGAAKDRLEAFLDRLSRFRVLDPACGSGNFLYVALHALKDIELRAMVDVSRLGLPTPALRVGLECVRGIEIEPYAAELARLTLWIGYLQWLTRNGYTGLSEPILSSLDQIECRDALFEADGREADWFAAGPVDAIIGNPPFLGGKRMRDGLGDDYVERLFDTYRGRVPAEADFVCYWVVKCWEAVKDAKAQRAGLVTTNSIRGGASRRVLDPIADARALQEAWADEPWVLDGAAVRVSMLGFGEGFVERRLEGRAAPNINPDLTGASVDLTRAAPLKENAGVAFQGVTKGAPFEISADQARQWLVAPVNVNNRQNADVLRPITSGGDIVRQLEIPWVIDFAGMSMEEAAKYELPFQYCLLHVEPIRRRNHRELYRRSWWEFIRPRPTFRLAVQNKRRYIATPKVSKKRVFVWRDTSILPDNLVVAVAHDDDATFGVLELRFHELWALRLGAWIGQGNDPTYTPSSTFETFPFPEGLTPNLPGDHDQFPSVASAAAELNRLREAWLNPPDLVVREAEVVPGYPDRILPVDEAAARELKRRTLTNLYNQRPAWLDMAHRALDEAVAAAYGWPADLSDEEVLERLFALNQERAAQGR